MTILSDIVYKLVALCRERERELDRKLVSKGGNSNFGDPGENSSSSIYAAESRGT